MKISRTNASHSIRLAQHPQKLASMLLENRIILCKAAVIIGSVIALYYSDLSLVFGNALEFTTGNITNYVITIPFLAAYIIYRKRNVLMTAATLDSRGNKLNRIRLDDIVGITLCGIALLLYLAGSATLYALEYHILSMPIFLAGSTLVIFNFATLRHAIVAMLLTLYLQPPPGQVVSELAADLSWTSAILVEGLLRSVGLPISLDSSFGAPALLVQNTAGVSTPFFVGEPSSGVFSTIGLSLFAVFVAYIIRGPTWKRLALFASGFPLFYLLNTLRIAIVITLWYLWGQDVSEAYHVISGSSMVAIGTLMILVLGEKALKLNIRSPRIQRADKCEMCSKCLAAHEMMCLSCGRLLGKLMQTLGRSVERIASIVFLTLIATTVVMTSIQASEADARKLSDLNIREISGPETTGYFLPEIQGWELRYAYRDNRVESILNQDAALAYRYIPTTNLHANSTTGANLAGTPIFSSVQISTGHHVWEDSLVTWPSRVGRPGATLLESEDIIVDDGKKGRYLLFQRLGSTSTEAVVYWFERTPLKFGSNFENRNVLISIWANTDSLARTGVIGGPTDSTKIKEVYLSLARPISKYWDDQSATLTSSYELLFVFINSNIQLLIVMISIPVVLFLIYHQVKKSSMSIKMRNLYRQLAQEDMYFIEALVQSIGHGTKRRTGSSIAKIYSTLSKRELDPDRLAYMLNLARRTGLVTDSIASVNDQSLLVWRINFKTNNNNSRKDPKSFLARMYQGLKKKGKNIFSLKLSGKYDDHGNYNRDNPIFRDSKRG